MDRSTLLGVIAGLPRRKLFVAERHGDELSHPPEDSNADRANGSSPIYRLDVPEAGTFLKKHSVAVDDDFHPDLPSLMR